jgi:tetratricopeptide (TPR) repeat protein
MQMNDFMNMLSDAMNKAKEWDQFPSGNICEILRPIQRRSFDFEYHTLQVWKAGECVVEKKGDFKLTALVQNDVLQVFLQDPRLTYYVQSKFSFAQISENLDRIMWTTDIYNQNPRRIPKTPSLMSLFYKNGIIRRIYINVDEFLLEFTGQETSQKRNIPMNNNVTVRPVNPNDPNDAKLIEMAYGGVDLKIDKCVKLKRTGDFESANRIYNELDQQFPNTAKILKSWAKTLLCLRRYNEAIEKFTTAAKIYDQERDMQNAHICRANAKEIQNRYKNTSAFIECVVANSGGSINKHQVKLEDINEKGNSDTNNESTGCLGIILIFLFPFLYLLK